MNKFIVSSLILIMSLSALLACKTAETSIDSSTQSAPPIKTEIKEPTPFINEEPVPDIKFSATQQKRLDEFLPAKVRKFLETSDDFQLLGEVEFKDDEAVYPGSESLRPNLKVIASDANERKRILNYLYQDISTKGYRASCWMPHHVLRAAKGGEEIQIEICFSCSGFSVDGALGKFSGTIGGGERTEKFFNELLKKHGVSSN